MFVYNGENAMGEVLGVFNGSHPPPEEGIYSSSNRIFVVFKSDKNGSDTGFIASYCGVNIRGKFLLTFVFIPNYYSKHLKILITF